MGRFLPRRPSPALVVAVIALVAALGGTSYAAFSLPKNSVGSKQLKKNAVTTKKIKNGAVTSSKINPAGLTVPDASHANSADSAGTASHLATLPSGSTESGSFAAAGPSNGTSDYLGVGITFAQPLSAPVTAVVATFSTTSQCPGVGSASPGVLCLYMYQAYHTAGTAPNYVYRNEPVGAGKYGVILYWDTTSGFTPFVSGSWSVTGA